MNLPYDYYPAVLNVIDLISQGYTKTSACDENNIHMTTFDNYIKNNLTLQELLIEAEQRCYDAMADALLNPDNHDIYGHSDPKMAKVQSDNMKWFLDKKDRKRYGERVTVDHNLTADKAIVAALTAGRQRAHHLEFRDVEEAEFVDVTPVNEDEILLAEICS